MEEFFEKWSTIRLTQGAAGSPSVRFPSDLAVGSRGIGEFTSNPLPKSEETTHEILQSGFAWQRPAVLQEILLVRCHRKAACVG